ncbi:hypothetical protein ACFVGM_31360 [Kitasatospora purpeofusca]|uniref:hypothetical protein n=1 Tax=Kitasatospora purpeofusca TaxID=67352 RepID=UPI0036A05EE9
MSPDQQSGRRLHEAMRHTSDAFGPHRADLVLGAAARGRRLRLVRRARIAALAAAVAGAAVLGAAQLSPGTAPAPSPAVTPTSTPPAPPAPAPTATLVPVPTRPPSAAPPLGGPRSGPISAQLAAFMPPGTTTRVSSNGAFEDGRVTLSEIQTASGTVLHDDGHGRGSVTVGLSDYSPRTPDCDPGPWHCEILDDGTSVRAEKVRLTSGYLLWTVSVLRPDGRHITVAEYNTDRIIPIDATTASPTRAEPPLTIDQLQGIALSPHWNR